MFIFNAFNVQRSLQVVGLNYIFLLNVFSSIKYLVWRTWKHEDYMVKWDKTRSSLFCFGKYSRRVLFDRIHSGSRMLS